MKLMPAVALFTTFVVLATAQNPPYKKCPKYTWKLYSATAQKAVWLENAITSYRAALGGQDNGNAAGPLLYGHRSINWDAPAVPFYMPGDFFKRVVTRGAEFRTVGGRFAVSNPSATDPSGVKDIRFSSFDKRFPFRFTTFSAPRLFTSVKSNVFKAFFSIPAKNRKATVSGFGAIFTNVRVPRRTKISYYDNNNCLIATVYAKPKPRGLSFVGIIVTKKNYKPVKSAIASAQVTLGTAIISQKFSWWPYWRNFVVVDDLIYGEPQIL